MFNRAPRMPVPLPTETVRIPDLPELPPKPGNANWVTLALTAGVTFVGAILIAALMKNSMYLFMLVFSVGSTVASILNYVVSKRSYRRELAAALARYDEEIARVAAALGALRKEQQRLLAQMNPDLRECLARALRRDPRLGERRPEDADFLCIRVGTGRVPSSVAIDTPNLERPAAELKPQVQAILTLRDEYQHVPDVPITIDLRETAHWGIVGAESDVAGLARALLCHITAHHWPTEVQVAVICESGHSPKWWWANYLPNLWQGAVSEIARPRPGVPAADGLKALEDELDWRFSTVDHGTDAGRQSEKPVILPKLVVIFDHLQNPLEHAVIQRLVDDRQGTLGVHAMFLANTIEEVPGNCGAVLTVQPGVVEYTRCGITGTPTKVAADTPLDYQAAETLARALAGVGWLRIDRVGGPPDQVPFLAMFGVHDLQSMPIESWWRGDPPFGYLRVPLGQTSPGRNLWFDLNDRDDAHGPHGLIGGTTGSGKSEFLKTLALALAVTHHPYELNFALVDFKGGAAFNELRHLPHTVGVITDIESHADYCLRMLQALTGEIEYRKRVIEDARARYGLARSHIDDYRSLPDRPPLPRLVIIFDEFASFKERFPEHSKALINIARQGRSLGVHLILSTQSLSTIDENIRQNSRFRILLRVATESDSREIIGTSAAHRIQRRGRAYFFVNTPVEFQSAYAGGPYSPMSRGTTPDDAIVRRWPDGRTQVIFPIAADTQAEKTAGSGTTKTQAQAVIEHLRGLASSMGLNEPRRVWPDPLPERLFLPQLMRQHQIGGWNGQTWCSVDEPLAPVLGLCDDPLKQRQPLFRFEALKGDGHLLVFGQPGSGKSTLLQTVVAGLACMHSPNDVWIYVLDFGGQASMKVVEGFPHVGGVITLNEVERIDRLFQKASSTIAARGELFRQAGVNDLAAYNARVDPAHRLPAIFILIDGFGVFRRAFLADNPLLYQQPAALLNGGKAAGIHLVVTAGQWAEVDDRITSNVSSAIALRVGSSAELHNIVGATGSSDLRHETGLGVPSGRGFVRGNPVLEFQAALPAEGETDEDRLSLVKQLMAEMSAAAQREGCHRAQSIDMLPTTVSLDSVRSAAERGPLDGAAPIGLDYETLEPIGLSLRKSGPGFMIAGSIPQAGKSTVLTSWLLSEALDASPELLQLVLVGFHSRSVLPLASMPHVVKFVGLSTELADVLNQLELEVQRRQREVESAYQADPVGFDESLVVQRFPLLVVVIDDYEAFTLRTEDKDLNQLDKFLARGGDLGARVVIADDVPRLSSRPFNDSLAKRIKSYGCGILVGGANGLDLFGNVKLAPELRRSVLPLGRGFIINRGAVRLFQGAQYWAGDEPPSAAARRHAQRLTERSRGSIMARGEC